MTMVEAESSYRRLDENVWPDCYVVSLLNTLNDDEFQKLRVENQILMKTSVGNQTNQVDTTVDREEGKLVFIVPNPEHLKKMATGEALELMKGKVDEFMRQFRESKKNEICL